MKKVALASLAVLMAAKIACVAVRRRVEAVSLIASPPESCPSVEYDSRADEADSIPTFEETIGSASARHSPDVPSFLKAPPPPSATDTRSPQKCLQISTAEMHLQQAPAPYNPYLDPFFAGTWIGGPCVRRPRPSCGRPRDGPYNRRQRCEFRRCNGSWGRRRSDDSDDEFIAEEYVDRRQPCGRGACPRGGAKLLANDAPDLIAKIDAPLHTEHAKDDAMQVESDYEYGDEEDVDDISTDEDEQRIAVKNTAGDAEPQSGQAKEVVKRDTLTIAKQLVRPAADKSSPRPARQQIGNNSSASLYPPQASSGKKTQQPVYLIPDDDDDYDDNNDEDEPRRDLCR